MTDDTNTAIRALAEALRDDPQAAAALRDALSGPGLPKRSELAKTYDERGRPYDPVRAAQARRLSEGTTRAMNARNARTDGGRTPSGWRDEAEAEDRLAAERRALVKRRRAALEADLARPAAPLAVIR